MINRIAIQNYKALRDVAIALTPIHVLIGPNDSGKSSILEAIAALCRSVDHPLNQAFVGSWEGRQLVWRGAEDLMITLKASITDGTQSFDYRLSCDCLANGRQMIVEDESVLFPSSEIVKLGHKGNSESRVYTVVSRGGKQFSDDIPKTAASVYGALAGVHSFRWDARFLSLPVAPDSQRRFRMERSGFGLALCLDDILGDDRQRFTALEDRFRSIFPQIKSIKLRPEPAYKSPVDSPDQIEMLQRSEGKGIYFEIEGSAEPISARQVSDGVLLILAYLAVLHLPQPPRVVLVEEPENGIHPKRLQDVLQILRDLVSDQNQTQIVLTTHSPYAVDLFEPEEVTLCRKQPDGSINVQRLSESEVVRNQLGVFNLGEIWTAEGDDALAHNEAIK